MDPRVREALQQQDQDQKDMDAMLQGLDRLKERYNYLTLKLDFGQAVVIIGQLHLALRHPDNTGHTAEVAREVLRDWIGSLTEADAEVGEILRRRFPLDQRMQCEACFPPTFETELDEVRFAPGYQGEDD